MNPEKVYLPPLQIKIGLKNLFKTMGRNSAGLIHLKNNARIKECVFFWTSNERVNTGRKI
jgi:hypothetical protein